jgi:hypothetical protein
MHRRSCVVSTPEPLSNLCESDENPLPYALKSGQFWQAFAASAEILTKRALEGKVQLDGTQYRVQYDGAMEHLSLTFQDSEVGKDQPDDLPLARWMNSIRAQVEKMAGKPGEDRAPTAR